VLRLQVTEFGGPTAWRWRLTEAEGGAFVADEQVRLNEEDWQFEAYSDLDGFLRWRAAPDQRSRSEAELVASVGEWVGANVLGRIGPALVERAPVRVLVEVPAAAEVLAYRPLELAWVDGRPLSMQGVSLVLAVAGARQRQQAPVGKRLRMLGVFSLPVDASALNLRRERIGLAQLVQEIAATHSRAVELRVLQYGVTRERLREVMLEREGWDVVHISGHGLPAGLLLEREDGRHDLISSTDLVELLEPAAAQLKLVLMSSCESGALTAAQHLRLLGIAPPSPIAEPAEDGGPNRGAGGAAVGELPAVAAALAGRLDCAVVAMRYPVVDDFAIGLAERLYELVLGRGQPLARALGLALPDVVRDPPTPDAPAISVATPALFGARAVDLELDLPAGESVIFDVDQEKLADFEPQPRHFVGRVGPMTRATAVLAPGSDHTGVLFHGMAGAGKTACALELAYTHEQSFGRLVWHKAPPEDDDIAPALSQMALHLEAQLPGVRMAHLVDNVEELRAFLPKLSSFLRRERVLIVLDNCESLLTEGGEWRDERWAMVLAALAGHGGLSRLVVTSRRRPVALPDGMLVEAVHALSITEAVLLAREWPHLRALLDGTAPDLSLDEAHELAARTLAMAQGHPKLIELADGQAADPQALRARLSDADQTWQGAGIEPGEFLEHGESAADDADYLKVLDRWTRGTAGGLAAGGRLLFDFLCCMEPDDRIQAAVADNWADVWTRLERPGEPPDLLDALATLTEHALVETEGDPDSTVAIYHVHPAVAATGRADADEDVQAAVDHELSAYWLTTLSTALEREDEELGWLVLRAGRGAVPYLLRLHAWPELRWAGEMVLLRDPSARTGSALLPVLRQAAAAAVGSDEELSLRRSVARALERLRPAEAATQFGEVLDAAEAREDYELAGVCAGDLIRLMKNDGRLHDALALTERMQEFDRLAGLGPWTEVGNEGQRLQLLVLLGNHEEVLDTVNALRQRMSELPEPSEHRETRAPFSVREGILDLGSEAAARLGKWDEALELNEAILDSKRRRGASGLELARTMFNGYGPMLRVGRLGEARAVLLACRDIYHQEGDVNALASTLSALADLEDELGHGDEAVSLEADALRLGYAGATPDGISISHSNLSGYLRRYDGDPSEALAHRLAGTIIDFLSSSGRLPDRLRGVVISLAEREPADPPSWDEVCALVGRREGVRLAELVARLPRRAPDGPSALAEVVRLARELPADEGHDGFLAAWEPVLSALLAARGGDAQAAEILERALSVRAEQPDWVALSAVLRRLAAGEDVADPLAGLDPIDKAIAQRAVDALDGRAAIDADAWQTLLNPPDDQGAALEDQLTTLVEVVVAAARGDAAAAEALQPVLADMADRDDWTTLAAVVQRILTGERDAALLEGLDETDTGVTRDILSALADQPAADPNPPPNSQQPVP
jgi:tetratricopeptide (TPR) repeat protein